MKHNIEKGDKYTVFTIEEDRLDAVVSPDVKSHMVILKSEGNKNIIMDLSHIKYADSSGLSAILTANRICKEQNGLLVLTNCNDQVKKLMEITQLHRVIELLPSNQEAIDRIYMYELDQDLGNSEE